MPDDYYVSQYSGEEIDALLGSAVAGTVRYDAAQTLTDAQKARARANIAAAPDGFGLGNGSVTLTASDDLDNVTGNGWYSWGSLAPANAPALIHFDAEPGYCCMFMIGSSQIVISQNDRNNMAMRAKNIDGWTPWEYVNPPLKPGVEYRTTERYLGKPVYVKLVDFGALPNAGLKQVAHGLTNVAFAAVDLSRSIAGIIYNNLFPLNSNISGVDLSDGYINIRTLIDLTGYNATICLKYAKNSD